MMALERIYEVIIFVLNAIDKLKHLKYDDLIKTITFHHDNRLSNCLFASNFDDHFVETDYFQRISVEQQTQHDPNYYAYSIMLIFWPRTNELFQSVKMFSQNP